MRTRLLVSVSFVLFGLLSLLAQVVSADTSQTVAVVRLKGVINPVTSAYVTRSLQIAHDQGAHAVVIEIDTPGGLDTSMQEMIQAIVSSKIPVIAYVSPQGGRAASAGLFVVMASHVAAMAPNTNIGSAHPVSADDTQMDETMTAKVTNDAVARIKSLADRRGRNVEWVEKAVRESVNVTENEALDLHVVDLVAPDIATLLKQVDGREVALADGNVTLKTADARTSPLEMNFIEQFLLVISDPNIAYILLTLGINGILFELMSPGAILPGVIGGISLLLAFFALGMLPINYAGIGLIVLAFILFILDIKMPTHGILTVGGLASMVLGSLVLVNSDAPYFAISWSVIAGAVISTVGFFVFAITAVVRSYRKPSVTGREGVRTAIGMTKTDLNPQGIVLLQGENWEGFSESGTISKGTRVQVTAVNGLRLTVRAWSAEPSDVVKEKGEERKVWEQLGS